MNAELYNLQLKDWSEKRATPNILNEIRKFLFEYKDPKMRPLSIQEKAFVYETDKENYIGNIGASIPNDLFTNNWGQALAGICQPVSTANLNSRDYLDITGSQTGLIVSRKNNGNSFQPSLTSVSSDGAQGSELQFGQGTGAPAKTDFKLETLFPNAPESDRKATTSSLNPFNSGLGVWTLSAQIINITDSISIKEIGWFFTVFRSAVKFVWIMAHDSVNPNVLVNSGNNINGEYVLSVGN